MKKRLPFFLLFSILLLGHSASNIAYAQSGTTVSASCGKCGKPVSKNSRVGQRCPHCGVIWGRENTTTSSSYSSRRIKSYDFPNSNYDMPSSAGYTSFSDTDISSFSDGYTNTISNCNLRAAPSTKAKIIGVIAQNESVTILRRSGPWVKVSYMGGLNGGSLNFNTGWVHRSNLVY